MSIKSLIAALNSLSVGELSTLEGRLRQAREQSAQLGLSEVEQILAEASQRLDASDLKGFRKRIHHAVSRLGHVREQRSAERSGQASGRFGRRAHE
ncbi:MAG: hypothetical protein JSV80_02925 [Acidobacteriota bacterium]|nr:MAG: hypothetical protein JSV80_02925 [Acidobacteriota bacterium]